MHRSLSSYHNENAPVCKADIRRHCVIRSGQMPLQTKTPGCAIPGSFRLERKSSGLMQWRLMTSRHTLNSAVVAIVPLVGRLVVLPELSEPANEPRLCLFHKSGHGSLLGV